MEVLHFPLQVRIEDVDLVLGKLDVPLVGHVAHLSVLAGATLDCWHPLLDNFSPDLVLLANRLPHKTCKLANLLLEHLEFSSFSH